MHFIINGSRNIAKMRNLKGISVEKNIRQKEFLKKLFYIEAILPLFIQIKREDFF